MTPKTLAKERREKFEAIIFSSELYAMAEEDQFAGKEERANAVKTLAALLAEAAESRTEKKLQGIEWAMVEGRKVEASDIQTVAEANAELDAFRAFERDMQCPGSWSWYPAKSSDEPAWRSLREFVVSLYQSDNKAFEKYYTWARDPYARGAKLPIHIRQDPTCFEYAWKAYQAANPSVNSTFATDLPTYKLEDNSKFVPAPEKK